MPHRQSCTRRHQHQGLSLLYQPSSERLVVNQVFDSATPAGEFFELYNGTSAVVDLSEYAIYNRDGSDPLGQLETRTIPADGFLTVPASALGGTIGGPTGLVHGGDFLALVVTGTTGTVVDLVNWGNANPNWPNYPRFSAFFFSPAPIMPPADLSYSLQRWPDGHDSDLEADWRAVECSPSGPSCADPYEPDGSPRYSAPALKPGQSQLHRFCPAGELDYIGIYTSPGLIYTIETTDEGDLADTAIVLEDSTGIIRGTGTGRADARGERIVYWSFGGGGPFFVRVADAAGRGGTGPAFLYRISLRVEPVPTAIPTSTAPPFSDVRPTDYFYQAVMDLTRRGIISGYSDGTFRPYNSTTRAQLVKLVVGVEPWEINTTGGPHFSDVAPDHAF